MRYASAEMNSTYAATYAIQKIHIILHAIQVLIKFSGPGVLQKGVFIALSLSS